MPKKTAKPIKQDPIQRKSSVDVRRPPVAPKRWRLTKKQYRFFRTVFVDGHSIEQALDMHGIRCRTVHRWLAAPFFMRELQTNLERCYIQARVEMIRDFPKAIKTVLNISDKLMRPEDFRRLCSELVRLYSEFGRMERAVKRPQAAEPVRFDVLMEQCGVKLSPGGVIRASSDVAQLPQKPVFQLKNAENDLVPELSDENRGNFPHKTKGSAE
jgi:hypothetical protein